MSTASRPFIWEKNYPAGVSWDTPIPRVTLSQMFDEAAARFHDRPALTFMGHSITYARFADLVARLAAALTAEGVGKDTPVALFLPNVPWHPVFYFAVLKAGGRVVHLSPLDADREIAHKLKDSGAKLLVTSDIVPGLVDAARKICAAGFCERIVVGETTFWLGAAGTAATDAKTLSARTMLETPPLPASAFPVSEPDDVALLQYTGGTTGLPKAAMLTHANLTATMEIINAWSAPQGWINPGRDTSILVLPLFHIFALLLLNAAVVTGANTVLHPRFDAEAVVTDIEKYKPSGFNGVPTMWIALLNLPGIEQRDLSSLRFARSGGAACPLEIEHRFKSLTGVVMGGGWGMTETSPLGTAIPADNKKPGTIGLPLPNIEMDIVALDDPARRLGPNEIGEIRIKGPNVIRGYFNRPEENARAFVDGFLLTGDIGHHDEDGYFFIVDRKKDMIISGGFNVYPRHIEEALYEHPDVAEVIVIGVADDYRGEAAKAFVTLKPGRPEFTLESLRGFVADKLAKYEVPTHLEFRRELPRTAVGKLSKKELVAEEKAKRRAS